MFFNCTLAGLDATQAGQTAMTRAPSLNGGQFCPMILKVVLDSASNGLTPIVPPTLSIGSAAPWNDVLKATALPAALILPGFHHTAMLPVARHGIAGAISVNVVTPAVASVYLVDILVIGITC